VALTNVPFLGNGLNVVKIMPETAIRVSHLRLSVASLNGSGTNPSTVRFL
jgi:hypothetical protein